jgi:NurA-like 5'-3' nuclease
MNIQKVVLTALLVLQATVVLSQEARVELRSTVTGNQEQPKVLYIVPWQQALSPQLRYQPMQSLVEDVYEEVERDEFLRELNYREKINASLQGEP